MKTAIISIGAILVLLGVTFAVKKVIEATAPEVQKKELEVRVPVVEVLPVSLGDLPVDLRSEGVVRSRRETVLSAEVAGRIVEVHPDFEEGAIFEEGEIIARIDPVNYRAAVAQAEASLAEARVGLVQEEARAEQAVRDWAKIGGGREATDLVLRKPYVERARVMVAAAEAAHDRATADLERTIIRAPFSCRIRQVNLNLGSTVAAGTALAAIYDHETVLVNLPFPLQDFGQISSEAEVVLEATMGGEQVEWRGTVRRELGEVNEQTLAAYLMVEVEEKAEGTGRFRLPLPGMFVRARVMGLVLPGVLEIPRRAVQGRNEVMVLNEDESLEFRTVEVVRTTPEAVYVRKGLKEGERVILTKLDVPVAGMKLRVMTETEEAKK